MKTSVLASEEYVFFRVPKVATTSISMYLKNNSKVIADDHTYEYIESNWKNHFKFSFVRNPWDRLLSCFLDKTKQSIGTVYEMKFYKRYEHHNFEEFICSLNSDFITYDGHIKPQNKFFDIESLDFLGRFETINHDVKCLQALLGLPEVTISCENKTKHTHYREYYNTRTKDIVANLYEKDIELFEYEY